MAQDQASIEKTDNSYFCIFGARHDAGLVREPARDNRNDDASDYDKYCAYAHATVATDGSDHRRRLLSRERAQIRLRTRVDDFAPAAALSGAHCAG
jgi:hypothetical protein